MSRGSLPYIVHATRIPVIPHSNMYPVVLQPQRRSSILSRDLLLTPQNQQDPIPSEDLFHENRPEDPDPSCCLTATSIRRRAVAYGHIAIAKALVTPFSGLGCILMGQLLRLSFANSGEQYTSPPYMTALAGLVGGFCLTGSVIFLNILLDITPCSGTRWHKYLTWPYFFIICAASAAAGPLGVLIVNFNRRPNSEILDLIHAVSASGLGAGIVFSCLLLLKCLIYGKCIPVSLVTPPNS